LKFVSANNEEAKNYLASKLNSQVFENEDLRIQNRRLEDLYANKCKQLEQISVELQNKIDL
jgi:hypothetical protein